MNARSMPQSFRRRLLTALVAAVCLAPVALPVMPVEAAPGYKPGRKKAAQRTTTTATRAEDYRLGKAICTTTDWSVIMPELVADDEYDVQTSLTRPPLLFYTPRSSVGASTRIEVQLYESNNFEKPIVQERYKTTKSGLLQIAYPATAPDLVPGKAYEWRVNISCPNDESGLSGRVAAGKFTTIAPTTDLMNQIDQATTAEQKAEIYASSGLWTEAFLASKPTDRLALMEQIKLKNTVLAAIRLTPNTVILPAVRATTRPQPSIKLTEPKQP